MSGWKPSAYKSKSAVGKEWNYEVGWNEEINLVNMAMYKMLSYNYYNKYL